MIPVIQIVNESARPDVAGALPAILHAIGEQLAKDVQPLWGGVLPALVSARARPANGDAWIALVDGSDADGLLGVHEEDALLSGAGVPTGYVFVGALLAAGGSITSGPLSVSATLDHEVLEMFGDPSVNLWADAPDGYSYAVELCDAVESDVYDLAGVSLSNFVQPAFFDPRASRDMLLDRMGLVDRPFETRSGGYQIRRSAAGDVGQVWGASYPTWKRALKEHKRARRARSGRSSAQTCQLPPPGWRCTREPGHLGPCAAWPSERT